MTIEYVNYTYYAQVFGGSYLESEIGEFLKKASEKVFYSVLPSAESAGVFSGDDDTAYRSAVCIEAENMLENGESDILFSSVRLGDFSLSDSGGDSNVRICRRAERLLDIQGLLFRGSSG